jgi:hypothetical protein
MTEAQFEKMKQEQRWCRYMDTRRIEEVFPNIAKIEITYQLHHGSAFGNQDKEGTWVVNLHSQMDFTIDCLNRECSSAGFDLKDEIYSLYRDKLTKKSGEMKCKGQEAPDHPEQSCDGRLKYTIKVLYKQPE